MQFTDKKSGITISSNGSAEGNTFLTHFLQISKEANELAEHRRKMIYEKYGHIRVIPPDGWAEKCHQKGDTAYKGQLLNAEVGKLLAVGWLSDSYNKDFYIYKIVDVKYSRFFPKDLFPDAPPTVYGKFVERFVA